MEHFVKVSVVKNGFIVTAVSVVQWLSHPLNTRKVLSSILSGNKYFYFIYQYVGCLHTTYSTGLSRRPNAYILIFIFILEMDVDETKCIIKQIIHVHSCIYEYFYMWNRFALSRKNRCHSLTTRFTQKLSYVCRQIK